MDDITLGKFKQMTTEEIKESCSVNVTSDGEFLFMAIIPPVDWVKADITNLIEDTERLIGKRK